MIGKLFGLITVGSAVTGRGLWRHFLSTAVNILILAIVGAFMLCALLTSSFYMIYFCLVQYGVDPQLARAILSVVVLVVALLVMGVTYDQWRKLRALSRGGLCERKNSIPDVACVVEAFIDGFLNHKK